METGAEVHVAARHHTSLFRLRAFNCDAVIHRLDLMDRPAVQSCLEDLQPHYIVHLATDTAHHRRHAAVTPVSGNEPDPAILKQLLEVAAGLKTPPRAILRSGTVAEYGPQNTLPFREDDEAHPASAYGATMLRCTEIAQYMAASLPFPVRTARLGQSYGLLQSTQFLIPALIAACIEGHPFHIRNPQDNRDLTAVKDVVDGLLAYLTAPEAPDIVNIARGEAITMSETAQIIAHAANAPADLLSFGPKVKRSAASQCASIIRARRSLNWCAKIDAPTGLAKLVRAERQMRAMGDSSVEQRSSK